MTRGPDTIWPRRRYSDEELQTVQRLYSTMTAAEIGKRIGRSASAVHQIAFKLQLKMTLAQREALNRASGRATAQHPSAVAHRFKPGQVPANKGLRRPGWTAGRMAETMFKKGQFPPNHDPHYYVLGALRINHDGYIDMRISFEPGARGWRGLHLILWEDAHGPLPKSHCLRFKDGEKLNVCLENLELVSRAENMRRNTIHRLPKPVVQVIQLTGVINRLINRRTQNAREHN